MVSRCHGRSKCHIAECASRIGRGAVSYHGGSTSLLYSTRRCNPLMFPRRGDATSDMSPFGLNLGRFVGLENCACGGYS